MSALLAVSPLVHRAFPSLPVVDKPRAPYPVVIVRLAVEVEPDERFRMGARFVTCGSMEKARDFVRDFIGTLDAVWEGPSVQCLVQEYTEYVNAVTAVRSPDAEVDRTRTE